MEPCYRQNRRWRSVLFYGQEIGVRQNTTPYQVEQNPLNSNEHLVSALRGIRGSRYRSTCRGSRVLIPGSKVGNRSVYGGTVTFVWWLCVYCRAVETSRHPFPHGPILFRRPLKYPPLCHVASREMFARGSSLKIDHAGLGPATSSSSSPCMGSSALTLESSLTPSAASRSSSLTACFASQPS